MTYREDPDLSFLGKLPSSELADLVRSLTHDKDGDPRFTETLTVSDAYKRHHPDHAKYWELIAAEIQAFGGNTFATLFRGGKGVVYREVLTDVCTKLKVNFNKSSDVTQIEQNLLLKVLADALEKMNPAEVKELAESLGVTDFALMSKETVLAAFLTVFKAGGFKSYQYTVMLANLILKALIGRGLSFAGGAALTRTVAVLTGPVGWAITGIWTAFDIASPAYRVTIPAVIQVAALRQQQLHGKSST